MQEKNKTNQSSAEPEFSDQFLDEKQDDLDITATIEDEGNDDYIDALALNSKSEPALAPVKPDNKQTEIKDEKSKKSLDPGPKTNIGPLRRAKNFLRDWAQNPKKRAMTIACLAALFLLVAIVPTSRHFIFNSVGIRASASLLIVDETTKQPLKNASVTIGSQSSVTNEQGVATLHKLRLGKNEAKIERSAFAAQAKTVVVGLGNNTLGEIALVPVGLRYSFNVKDFLSNKPILKAEAVSGEFSAFSNEQGEAVLAVDIKDDKDITVEIRAAGYRTEKVTNSSGAENVKEIMMVPARKHAFVSKRSNKFDVYKIDADGKNEEVLLSASGSERDDMVLAAHPQKDIAALITTRENMRSDEGYLLSTLYVIDVNSGAKKSLGRSERFQVIDWTTDRLIYAQIASGESAEDPNRQKIFSYDFVSNQKTEIASSNYFNDVLVAQEKIYYAPSEAYQKGVNVSLFVVDPDGSNKQVLIENETWNIFRTKYDELTIAVGKTWYKYKIGGTEKPIAQNGAPEDPKSRTYISSPNQQHSLWVDERESKGVLLAYNIQKNEDKNLAAQNGIKLPVRWLNDSTVVYRVSTETETADYIVSLDGGEHKKLIDVTNTAGVDKWYYY